MGQLQDLIVNSVQLRQNFHSLSLKVQRLQDHHRYSLHLQVLIPRFRDNEQALNLFYGHHQEYFKNLANILRVFGI